MTSIINVLSGGGGGNIDETVECGFCMPAKEKTVM